MSYIIMFDIVDSRLPLLKSIDHADRLFIQEFPRQRKYSACDLKSTYCVFTVEQIWPISLMTGVMRMRLMIGFALSKTIFCKFEHD